MAKLTVSLRVVRCAVAALQASDDNHILSDDIYHNMIQFLDQCVGESLLLFCRFGVWRPCLMCFLDPSVHPFALRLHAGTCFCLSLSHAWTDCRHLKRLASLLNVRCVNVCVRVQISRGSGCGTLAFPAPRTTTASSASR